MKFFSEKPPDRYEPRWWHRVLQMLEQVINKNDTFSETFGVSGIHATGNSDLSGSVEIVSGTNMTVTHSSGKLVFASAGEAGPKGDTGDVGPAGPRGPRGYQGEPGDVTMVGNIDCGAPDTEYGGTLEFDGGGV